MTRYRKLRRDHYWNLKTTNHRLLRKYKLTSPWFLDLVDSLPEGYRELIHAVCKDMYDLFEELDEQVAAAYHDYDPHSLVDIFTYLFHQMDLEWDGLPEAFLQARAHI